MSKVRLVKTNFTAGEISPQLLGRGDLRAYENGARYLKNVAIQPTGGLTRRQGTYYIDTALGKGRLIGFEFNAEQTYLLVLTQGKLAIYGQGLLITTINTPWQELHLRNLTWTQSADTVLLCHPDVPPQKLIRRSHTEWALEQWSFTALGTNAILQQPYYKFADDAVTMSSSNLSGGTTLTCSAPYFKTIHNNTFLRMRNKTIRIIGITSPTTASCQIFETLPSGDATADWQEQVFSPAHGWPHCAAFHQDRLVIGGSRDLPNRLWFSCSGDLWNFNKGTGLDNESIEFGLFSDQINSIRALFSGRHLQVFTSGAEWIVTGTPLTPTNIQLNRQTRIGSPLDRYIPPIDVDGATLFVGKTGQELREFLYTDLEQAYQANDLALMARHFMNQPVDQCFDPLQRILYLPLEDGTVAALTIYRTESVFAWSRLETDGAILSMVTIGSVVYALIRRDDTYMIERFDPDLLLDSALTGENQNPVTTWSGLAHLNNRDVMVVADQNAVGIVRVVNNQITLNEPARHITVGIPYTHVIEPLPPSVMSIDGSGRAIRFVRGTFRLLNTRALHVNDGRGLRPVPLRRFNEAQLDHVPDNFTGDVTIRSFGWSKDSTRSFWRVEQDTPLPCTILNVTMELKVND